MNKFRWILALLCLVSSVSSAQTFSVEPDSFAIEFKRWMEASPSAETKRMGNEFYKTWYSRAFRGRKDSIRNLTQNMVDKGFSRQGPITDMVKVIVAGANHQILESPAYDSLLYMIDQTAKYYDGQTLSRVLNTVELYLERKQLYRSNYYRLRTFDVEETTFSFVAPASLAYDDYYQDDYVEYNDSEDSWGTSDEEEDDWDWGDSGDDDTEWSDDWDDWSTGPADEEEVVEETYEEDYSVFETEALPREGPIMHLENVSLVMGTRWDSVAIQNTTGDVHLITNMFEGESGKFDWSSTGLPPETVWADLGRFNFDIRRPELSADKVTMNYEGYIKYPVEGIFDYQSRRHRTPSAAVYPRFMAYDAQVEIIALGDPILTYQGGFGLIGPNVNTRSVNEGFSLLTARDSTGLLFRAKSRQFDFEKDGYELTTDRASVAMYQGGDSIYHPMVEFRYTVPIRHLTVQSPDNDFKNHPFHASLYGMDFYTDVVYWDLNTDTLDITILNAKNKVPAVFESQDYFNERSFSNFGQTYGFHPMLVFASYASKVKSNTINLEDVSAQTGLPVGRLEGAAKILAARGFIKYDGLLKDVVIQPRLWHYVRAKFRKKDFDNMFITSLEGTDPNATVNRRTGELTVRGIPKFYISQELETYIVPDNQSITLIGDRDFKFDGELQVGNFQFIGEDFTFKYDAFLVELTKIDSIRFFIEVVDANGNVQRKLIDNQLVGVNAADSLSGVPGINMNVNATAGIIYINKPDNKSGAKEYADYPVFDANQGAIVYFNDPTILDGIYGESLYYVIPPFKIDSLADSDPGAISFPGTFYSNGILPPIQESLVVTGDNILGFNHKVPEEGLPLYDGKARVYNDIVMDRNGLQANGVIDYLSATLESERFTFYEDSVITQEGSHGIIKPGVLGGTSYPEAEVYNYSMNWYPNSDRMEIYNNGEPISFYNATASLDGEIDVRPEGATGAGTLLTRGSETRSEDYNFTEDAFIGRNAYFEVKSDNPRKPAVLGTDVRLDFQLGQNQAEIRPEEEGIASIGFPYAQYKTSIPSAVWDLTDNRITMTKPDDVPIENSYFYSTRKAQDSLVFNATTAVYIIDSLKMRVGGIPYIVVADAFIIPNNNQVVIQQGAQIEKLQRAELYIDTLNEYHNLFDGTIDIVSRKRFDGQATYRLVNSAADTFAIDLGRFQLVEDENARRGDKQFNTVSAGAIEEIDNVIISPGMVYRGRVTMYANQPALELNGFVKLDFQTVPNYDEWIRYSSSAESQKVIFDFNTANTEGGRTLEGGLHFDQQSGQLYHTFVTRKRNSVDPDFFVPSGNLYYDEGTYDFVIVDPLKDTADAWAGKSFRFQESKQEIEFEGAVTFMEDEPGANLTAAAKGEVLLDSAKVVLNAFMTMDFDIPNAVQNLMAADIYEIVEIMGAAEASRDPLAMTYLLAEIVGEDDARFFDEASLQEYTPLVNASRDLFKSLVFSDVSMEWSDEQKAWYNLDSRVGLSNVLDLDINAGLEGYMEIRRTLNGQELYLFLKAAPECWYYFQYSDNRIGIFSSNEVYNEEISARSNALKAKPGEFVFYSSDIAETLMFINRFRQTYYGIMDTYQLDDPVDGMDLPVTTDDDAFPGESDDDDDDGF